MLRLAMRTWDALFPTLLPGATIANGRARRQEIRRARAAASRAIASRLAPATDRLGLSVLADRAAPERSGRVPDRLDHRLSAGVRAGRPAEDTALGGRLAAGGLAAQHAAAGFHVPDAGLAPCRGGS